MMRTARIAVLVLLVAAPPAAAARDRCRLGGTTVAENHEIRVYHRSGFSSDGRDYVCVKRTGKRWRVAEYVEGVGESVVDVRLAGPVVAYWLHWSVKADDSGDWVVVLDTRRRMRSRFTFSARGGFGLTRAGTLVWSSAYTNSVDDWGYMIMAARAGKAALKLDEGRGIDIGSLAVGATRAFWLRDGEPHSSAVD
jgi:hypothetical protein